MRFRVTTILAATFLCLIPAVGSAQLASYGPQDFEAMSLTDRFALSDDGWLVFGNVFDPSFNYLYGYGPFDAPNSSAMGVPDAFSGLADGEGGSAQGLVQLNIFSDYQNADHANGNLIESNFFQEQTIGAGDLGTTWYFEFDAKLGTLAPPTTAIGFIKTLDPNDGFALTNLIEAEMTYIPDIWRRYAVSITIDAGLVGQILQFGFSNTATNYNPSGIFYDNVSFSQASSLDVPRTGMSGAGFGLRVLGNPAVAGAAQVLSFNLPEEGRVSVRVYDVTGRLVASLLDRELAAGPHEVAWKGRDAAGQPAGAGIYFAEIVTGSGRAAGKLIRTR